MTRRHWAHRTLGAVAVTAVAAAALAAAGPAAARPTGRADDPATAATAYLQARAAAVTSPHPAKALARWVVAKGSLARTEAEMAAGTALRGERHGRTPLSVQCRVRVRGVHTAADGRSAVVRAHAVTTITWRSSRGSDAEGSGVDHAIRLVRVHGRWLVTADIYADDTRAACLEAAGASRAVVRKATRALERTSSPPPMSVTACPAGQGPVLRYTTVIQYDRDAAKAYADAYALDYNDTYTHFDGADCANFASQTGHAGGMPIATGSSGWWYDKQGTSNPSDDTYSPSWINVGRQITFWNARRTDWVDSVNDLGRGDFIYYDWSGDGVWDHVAEVVGANSSGQKIVDAHTTDHYHTYWKLGSSSTKYRFARTRASWVV